MKLRRFASLLMSALALASAASCHETPPSPPVLVPASTALPPTAAATSAPSAAPQTAGKGSRYVPSRIFRSLGDGRLAAIVASRRVIWSSGATVVLEVKAVDDLREFQRIPGALGGGWLFLGEHSVRFA